MRPRPGSRRWALGNKRQKKKIHIWLSRACGCYYCCPEDNRQILREQQARRDIKDETQ